jgi:hypothetical protein
VLHTLTCDEPRTWHEATTVHEEAAELGAEGLPVGLFSDYSHQRLKAKGQMLARMEVRRKKGMA